MHWIDWTIMIVPFAAVLALAIRSRRYARDVSEMITNAIGPAIAAKFFIYFLGLPH